MDDLILLRPRRLEPSVPSLLLRDSRPPPGAAGAIHGAYPSHPLGAPYGSSSLLDIFSVC
ncbi:MAG: hypothetical protein FWD78_11050 [Treponema sp.]|nr:hypothetical protein [Treponema sp.]